MTRKDYRILADVLRGYTSAEAHAIAVSLAVSLAEENPRFKPEVFLKACGLADYDSGWITSLQGVRK